MIYLGPVKLESSVGTPGKINFEKHFFSVRRGMRQKLKIIKKSERFKNLEVSNAGLVF